MSIAPIVFVVIPVFNRIHFTHVCIKNLQAQSHPAIQIIVADGGSKDGSVETIRNEYPDVIVLTFKSELWWAGSMAMGIDYALSKSQSDNDFILMMNNDTQIPGDYIDKLVTASNTYDAAVGSLIVDSRDATIVLDAGEYIDWASYSFPVKNSVDIGETFCDDVDVLPGRGSLVPLKMIRKVGNVDSNSFPHYLADYEFFYRLKQCGYRLGVCYETRILAHIEETGIISSTDKSGFRTIWREVFSRRSMSNVIDHWRFIARHAPDKYRGVIQRKLLFRVVTNFASRTPVRPIFLPVFWLFRILLIIRGQIRAFVAFAKAIREQGINVLCHPRAFPGLIRWPLYLVASPGPVSLIDLKQNGFDSELLLAQGILRQLPVCSWYCLERVEFADSYEPLRLRSLFWSAWNPFRKIANTLAYRKDMVNKAKA